MRYSVSETAEYGDYVSGKRVIDARVRQTMKDVLAEVRDGSFAKRWIAEARRGAPELLATRAKEQDSQLERVGRSLRAMMPWLPKREFGQPAAPATKREPAAVA
jgi:ketol-acid reductoisomerase